MGVRTCSHVTDLFMVLAYITYRFFKKNSEAEEKKLKAFEAEVMQRLKEDKDNEFRV